MTDEDDADAPLGKLAHHLEQDIDLVPVETRGRLVENEHARRQIDGARNRSHVLDRHRILAEWRGHVDVEAELRQQRLGAPAHLALQHHPEARRLPAEKQVLRHREIGQQVHLLIDGRDTNIERGLGRARGDIDAAEPNDPRIARKYAGDHLDQGGFSGAVLAKQCVNLAGAEREIDTLQRLQRAKALADPTELQKSRRRIGAVVHRDITPTGARMNADARHVQLIRRFGQRVCGAGAGLTAARRHSGSVTETLLAVVDLLRIVGRSVEF